MTIRTMRIAARYRSRFPQRSPRIQLTPAFNTSKQTFIAVVLFGVSSRSDRMTPRIPAPTVIQKTHNNTCLNESGSSITPSGCDPDECLRPGSDGGSEGGGGGGGGGLGRAA